MKSIVGLTLGAAVVLGGCALHRIETPTAVPKQAPAESPAAPRPAATPTAVATGETNPPGAAKPEVVPGARSEKRGSERRIPSPTESSYVYAPQQAAVASRPAAPVSVAPAPAPAGSAAPREAAPPDEAQDSAPGRLQLSVVASASEIATGGIITVDVMASSDRAVVDAPLHLTFDPNVVEFVDGTVGDFLAQGGSSVVFFADGRTRPGDVAVAAGRVERTAGALGSGLLCRVRFRGTAAGTTPVAVGRAKAWGVDGEELVISSAGTTAVVR